MKRIKYFGVIVIAFFCFGLNACGQNSGKANSGKVNFGSYPADYEISYVDLLYSKAPTVRQLFGPSAALASNFQGMPATVILETASGNKNEFSATLLLSLELPDSDEMRKVMRLQVKFQPDSITKKSYVKYVKVENLISGSVSEQLSRGGEIEDGEVSGLFMGLMQYFWDATTLD